jgi:hypothetical protein
MKVVTAVVNNPEFILIQWFTLKKYMKCEYEYIVFNDAKAFPDFTNDGDSTVKDNIRMVCEQLDITCIDIPNNHHKTLLCAAGRCANSMNYILQYQKNNPDKYLLLDSDMFLIADFDMDRYKDYQATIVLQRSDIYGYYIWNGIYYFDMDKLDHQELLDWSVKQTGDVGVSMNNWVYKVTDGLKGVPTPDDIRWTDNKYRTDKIYFMKHYWSCSWGAEDELNLSPALLDFMKNDPRNQNGKFFCEIYDDIFLHYRAGGNWMREGMSLHKQLTAKLKDALIERAE